MSSTNVFPNIWVFKISGLWLRLTAKLTYGHRVLNVGSLDICPFWHGCILFPGGSWPWARKAPKLRPLLHWWQHWGPHMILRSSKLFQSHHDMRILWYDNICTFRSLNGHHVKRAQGNIKVWWFSVMLLLVKKMHPLALQIFIFSTPHVDITSEHNKGNTPNSYPAPCGFSFGNWKYWNWHWEPSPFSSPMKSVPK